jgi:hypothetical protein
MKNNLKYILISATAGLVLNVSCSKKLDEAYANPNAAVREPVETVLPSVIGSFIGSSAAAGSAYGIAGDALLIGRYIQYWGTYTTTFSPISFTAANQSNYDAMGGTVGASDNLGSVWAAHYYGMGQNLNRIVEWGTEEEKWDFVGAALTVRAWSMFTATNEYNHIILQEAFNTSLQQFHYQDQPEIYDSVRVIAFKALAYLNRSDGNQGQKFAEADAYLNGGDKNRWKKFAYGILARSYAYIMQKNVAYADSAIKYADLSCASNADNITCKFAAIGTSGSSNYFGPFRGNVGSIRQSAFIANLMKGANAGAFTGVFDPRTPYLLKEDTNGTFNGITPWKGSNGLPDTKDQPFNFWGNPYSSTGAPLTEQGRYIFRNNAEWPLMTASEMQFIKAEAALRKASNATALAAYVNAISLNFDMLTTKYNTSVPLAWQITPAQKAAYLADPAIVPATAAGLTLTRIMLQKYIALYAWGVQETWVDMRRYHYTNIDPVTGAQVYVNFTPPAGTDLFQDNGGKFVYRARMRYNSEYLYDIPSLQEIGAVNAAGGFILDYHTKECWFSKP